MKEGFVTRWKYVEPRQRTQLSNRLICQQTLTSGQSATDRGQEGDREAVELFDAYGLNRRSAHLRLIGEQSGERAHPLNVGSPLAEPSTPPLRATLSATIRLPRSDSLGARAKHSGLLGLSASIRIRSNGPRGEAAHLAPVPGAA
jgi:hypothetical protein